MTRRKFLQKLLGVGSAVILGMGRLVKKASPRRFVRAVRQRHYPGSLRPLKVIRKIGKWSG